jgi:hypothetical protein
MKINLKDKNYTFYVVTDYNTNPTTRTYILSKLPQKYLAKLFSNKRVFILRQGGGWMTLAQLTVRVRKELQNKLGLNAIVSVDRAIEEGFIKIVEFPELEWE